MHFTPRFLYFSGVRARSVFFLGFLTESRRYANETVNLSQSPNLVLAGEHIVEHCGWTGLKIVSRGEGSLATSLDFRFKTVATDSRAIIYCQAVLLPFCCIGKIYGIHYTFI